MITDAIQSALQAIIPNTFTTIGDEEIETPFCIHEERDEPIYVKDGIAGYTWGVEIAIIDVSPDSAEELAASGVAAINALAHTTSEKTDIGAITYLGTDPGFDQQTKEYIRILNFQIITTNR